MHPFLEDILYSVARNSLGNLITANDAQKQEDYSCPLCEAKMILKKSGKTGPGSKRPHFAHKVLITNCTPETALHYSFKQLLFEKIKNDIELQAPVNFSWDCKFCHEKHSGNLLKKVASVKLEHHLGSCQPDLSLFDQSGKIFCAIEVIVTHKPELKTIAFYNENGIICVEIKLKSDEDIYKLDEKLSNPTKVSICLNPKCKTCGDPMSIKHVTIIDGWCWRCGADMKAAAILMSASHLSPNEFNNQDIQLAQSKGVILRKSTRGQSLANVCPECNAFTANQFLFTEFISPAKFNKFPFQLVKAGYYCIHCKENSNTRKKLI